MPLEFVPGHRLTLLHSGADFFPALLDAIGSARHDIQLETYIFANDATGNAVGDALVDAARRGVRVRLLADGFGSPDFGRAVLPRLGDGGVEAMVYRPEHARFALRRHRLRRLHRKLCVIDGQIAFVGGINIVDDLSDGQSSPRFDFAVRVEGPVVAGIANAMRRLWHITRWVHLQRRPSATPDNCVAPDIAGHQHAAFLVRDNLRHRRSIERAYLAAILGARRHILIANAYFLPGRRFRQALVRAARRGVQITLLLQGCVEYRLQHYATQALYRRLLDNGIRIFEYRQGFLHAKVAVVDDHWATVGSSNIDPFSLLLAREANLCVDDATFATTLRRSLDQTIENHSSALAADHWQRMPWYSRGLRWACYTLIRLAISLTGLNQTR